MKNHFGSHFPRLDWNCCCQTMSQSQARNCCCQIRIQRRIVDRRHNFGGMDNQTRAPWHYCTRPVPLVAGTVRDYRRRVAPSTRPPDSRRHTRPIDQAHRADRNSFASRSRHLARQPPKRFVQWPPRSRPSGFHTKRPGRVGWCYYCWTEGTHPLRPAHSSNPRPHHLRLNYYFPRVLPSNT